MKEQALFPEPGDMTPDNAIAISTFGLDQAEGKYQLETSVSLSGPQGLYLGRDKKNPPPLRRLSPAFTSSAVPQQRLRP